MTLAVGCRTPEQTDPAVDDAIDVAKTEAVVETLSKLSEEAELYIPSVELYDDLPAWRRRGRLILVHNEESNVYRIPDGDENRLVSISIKGPSERPSLFFQSESNYLVELDPVDAERQHLFVINAEANWLEAYVITNTGVHPFKAKAYLDQIAEYEGIKAFFRSLSNDLPK